MPSVADCLRQHGPLFLQQHADTVTLGQRKVLSAITRCRTGEPGHVMFACQDCGRRHWVGRSCGNQHCPNCQHEKTQQWLKTSTDRLLPVEHFLVTFTVPTELRALLRAHPVEGYQALFAAGAATIASFWRIRSGWDRPASDSSESCTRGDAIRWSIIRTSTSLCRAEASAPTEHGDCRNNPARACQPCAAKI